MSSRPFKILVIGPTWVGDMVMTQSLFKIIKNRNPNTKIDVLAPAWSKEILGFMPEVSEVIISPFKHKKLQLKERFELARQIKTQNYDQAILIPNSFKSALVPFLAGVPLRTGWLGECRWGLLNDIRKLDKTLYPKFVQRFAALGVPKQEKIEHFPLPKFELDASVAEESLEKFKLNTRKPVLIVCPGAEKGPAKIWPPAYYTDVLKAKIKEGWQVWMIGSTKDIAVGAEIKIESPDFINLIGKTSLKEAVHLISYAQSVLTNDSGLMHIASAFNKPLVVIYGSTSPQNSPPLNELNKCIYLIH